MAKLTPTATYTNEELLALFREAYAKVVVQGVEFEFAGRRWTMTDADEIRKQIDWLQGQISATDNGLLVQPIVLGS